MRLKESAIEIVQIGAPHGVLDLGNTLRLYQDVVRSEIDLRAKNVLWYENAGGHTRSEAELLSNDITKRGSVVDAGAAMGISKKDGAVSGLERHVDANAVHVLSTPPAAEHDHHFLSQFFIDWLLKASAAPLSIFPESYTDEGRRESILHRSLEVTGALPVEDNSLDSLIAAVVERGRQLKGVVAERDAEIAAFIEQKALTLASTHTRVKILVLIGAEHPGIQPAMSKAFLDSAHYETRNFGPPVEGPEIDEEFIGADFNREKAARILCAKIIARQMKMMFLAQHQEILLKEPSRDPNGQTVFDHTLQVCQTAPLDAIHMFLQRMGRIDCGLSEAKYGNVISPPLLTPDPGAFQGRLSDLMNQWGVNDLSGSEVGIFMDRIFVSKFLSYAFDIPDKQKLRGLLKKLVDELPIGTIQELKSNITLYLRGAKPLERIDVILAKILQDQKFLALRDDLIQRKIIINVGGYAHLKLRIGD